MFSAIEIAEYFVRKADMSEDDITNLKVQKLLYYAQGFHLAEFGKPLFSEEILAWQHGPVVEEVYHRYKGFKNNQIEKDKDLKLPKMNKDTKDFLEEIYKSFAKYSAWALREMSHSETPWKKAWSEGVNTVIELNVLKKYFKARLANG